MNLKIAIIGAGIGGLTLALALKHAGFSFTVFESAPEIKPVGAGIVMAKNAMQIFEKLGIKEKIENAGSKISSLKITNEQLQPILKVDLTDFEKQYGVYNVAIHRADLQRVLAEEVGFENIHLSKRLQNIEKTKRYSLEFEDGTISACDILFGADGIHSQVRKQLFREAVIRDSEQRCWRGVLNIDSDIKITDETFESWGKGKRFGASKINENQIYWFAVINKSLIKNKNINELFSEFHSDIQQIISKTGENDIVYNSILDLKPFSPWQHETVCLMGDAAHATTPNMGQGACQAVEDAYVISELLKQGKSFAETFKQYEKLRIKKAHDIVKTSWILGKIGHVENSFAIGFRNFFFKNFPKSVQKKQMNKVFNIDYF